MRAPSAERFDITNHAQGYNMGQWRTIYRRRVTRLRAGKKFDDETWVQAGEDLLKFFDSGLAKAGVHLH
jgi:hypothetical protein